MAAVVWLGQRIPVAERTRIPIIEARDHAAQLVAMNGTDPLVCALTSKGHTH
jgi:hypothetical protein